MLNFFLSNRGYSANYPPPTPSVPPDRTADVRSLEHRLDALELACAGMWLLLKNKYGATDDELVEAIHAVDARDGQIDGKSTPARAVCPRCGRPALTRQSDKCLWCGAHFRVIPL